MLSHDRVWAAIDALAERYSLSASGLAKRAGLDSTAFNKSKRLSSDGRPRWPSTESLAKIIEATGASLDEFTGLIEGRVSIHAASAGACFRCVRIVSGVTPTIDANSSRLMISSLDLRFRGACRGVAALAMTPHFGP